MTDFAILVVLLKPMELLGVGVRDMTMLFPPMWGLSAVSMIGMELHSAGEMTPMVKALFLQISSNYI